MYLHIAIGLRYAEIWSIHFSEWQYRDHRFVQLTIESGVTKKNPYLTPLIGPAFTMMKNIDHDEKHSPCWKTFIMTKKTFTALKNTHQDVGQNLPGKTLGQHQGQGWWGVDFEVWSRSRAVPGRNRHRHWYHRWIIIANVIAIKEPILKFVVQTYHALPKVRMSPL